MSLIRDRQESPDCCMLQVEVLTWVVVYHGVLPGQSNLSHSPSRVKIAYYSTYHIGTQTNLSGRSTRSGFEAWTCGLPELRRERMSRQGLGYWNDTEPSSDPEPGRSKSLSDTSRVLPRLYGDRH